MPLPTITTPTYELNLPSTGKKIKYRPFLVKEEKILILALDSRDQNQITNSVKDVLKKCVLTRGVKIDEEGGQLNVKERLSEVDKILKEYKRIKKQERSAFGEIKKLGLVDKNGQPLENKKEEDVKDNKKGITGTQTFKN